MSPDEPRPTAENEAPKKVEKVSEQEPLLTQEEFTAQMALLTERARAAGLKPIQTMAKTYAKQGLVILESLLDALETPEDPKKKG